MADPECSLEAENVSLGQTAVLISGSDDRDGYREPWGQTAGPTMAPKVKRAAPAD